MMILTVTANSALDKILYIDEWVACTPMRTSKVVTSVGGKGLDSSVVLRHLDVDTVGLCFVAGKAGKELVELVEAYGIMPEPVWVGGETRIAHVIVETQHHRHSHIIAGTLEVSAEHCQEFLAKYAARVGQAAWVICSGSVAPGLPRDLYGKLTEIAHQAGVPVLIDSAGAFIHGALAYHPDIIKMNWDEFRQTFQVKADTLEELEEQATGIYAGSNAKSLVLTLAEHGILAYSPEGAYHAFAPAQQAVNAAGAGDAVSSALTWRLASGDGWEEALRWAAATSAATVLTEGTADCRMEDILRIYLQVEVRELGQD